MVKAFTAFGILLVALSIWVSSAMNSGSISPKTAIVLLCIIFGVALVSIIGMAVMLYLRNNPGYDE